MVMWLYDWDLLILGHHAANFGDFRPCGRGNKTFSICHVISRDHIFKGLGEFIGETPHSNSPPCHV